VKDLEARLVATECLVVRNKLPSPKFCDSRIVFLYLDLSVAEEGVTKNI